LKKTATRFAALGLALSLAGCGSDGPTTTTPTTTLAPAPTTTVILQGGAGDIGPRILYVLNPFTTAGAGTLDVTVDWTFPEDNVEVYLAQGTCTIDQVNQRTCPFAGLSESATAKPERLHIVNLAAGTYSLMIGNRGPQTETVSYQVTLTR
jgi:hypothetical protein